MLLANIASRGAHIMFEPRPEPSHDAFRGLPHSPANNPQCALFAAASKKGALFIPLAKLPLRAHVMVQIHVSHGDLVPVQRLDK